MQTNEIAFLKKNHVKPFLWRLVKILPYPKAKPFYYVQFRYDTSSVDGYRINEVWHSHWQTVSTRRNDTKVYRTTDAAISDISSIDLNAKIVLNYAFNQGES